MKKLSCVLIVLVMLTVTGSLDSWICAQDTNTAVVSGDTSLELTVNKEQPERIISLGENLGSGIDSLTGKMSGFAGTWVDAKAFMGISWLKLIICFFLLLLVVIAERIIHYFFERRIKQRGPPETGTDSVASFLDALNKPLSLFILVYGAFWSFSPIFATFKTTEGLKVVATVASNAASLTGYVAIAWFAYRLVVFLEQYLMRKAAKTDSDLDDLLVPLVGKSLRIFVVVLTASIIIHSLTGLNLGPMLASLGIGGIAVAFAAKDSIANFLGSLTIIFDKPFSVGERIVIDNYDGVVEEVGFRSTRIRTFDGHQISIPNEKVINTTLENIGRRPFIRWRTNITITYDTPPDKVEKAVAIIREILDNHEGMHHDYPPRVFFNGFNDWSLNIQVTAYYHPPDFWTHQAWLHKTCLAILRGFENEGIDFAFPSQTVYLANDDERQLKLRLLRGDVSETPS